HTDAAFILDALASNGTIPLAIVAADSVGQCRSVGTVSGMVSVTTSPAWKRTAPVAIAFIKRKRAMIVSITVLCGLDWPFHILKGCLDPLASDEQTVWEIASPMRRSCDLHHQAPHLVDLSSHWQSPCQAWAWSNTQAQPQQGLYEMPSIHPFAKRQRDRLQCYGALLCSLTETALH